MALLELDDKVYKIPNKVMKAFEDLCDYIKDLEKENERLKEDYDILDKFDDKNIDDYEKLEEENKTFEDYNKYLNKQLDKLEERINKAIEYIKEYYDNFGWQELRPSNLKELMEILKGEE